MERIETRGWRRHWQTAVLERRRGVLPASFYLICQLLAVAFSAALRFRRWLYRWGILPTYRLDAKVISVGNMTLGGTGKTPMVELLARHLCQKGLTVAILTRGYGRATQGTQILYGGNGRWQEVGDEPLMLARSLPEVPIVVGADRVVGGRMAVEKFHPRAIILDDGFQHLRLQRDVDIVVIDAVSPFGNERLFPAGILREGLGSLRRAHLFLLNRVDQAGDLSKLLDVLAEINPHAAVAQAKYRPRSLRDLVSGRESPPQSLRDEPVLALSGIGNPVSLEMSLEQLGARLMVSMRFPDHHVYRPQDITEAIQKAQQLGATAVVTTEKDAIRLSPAKPWPVPILCLVVEMVVLSGSQALWELVERGV